MFRKAVAIVAAALAASSCSLTDAATSSSVLDEMTEEKMCALVTGESLRGALGAPVGDHVGRAGPGRTQVMSYRCKYFPEDDAEGSPWWLNTSLGVTPPEATDGEALDEEFTEGIGRYTGSEDKTVVPYREVPGVGAAAGYGEVPLFGHQLAVVFPVGEERLTVTVSTLNQVGPEQLTPVAEELIANLQR
ncbi:hypothetical protein [Nocardia fusca]|uniref:hypothetical protein n=1 Tax=Nocardia fusca TaxID=941183 RepID=UPI000AAB99BD|nr:hypothetical protein [Nocardia fusca]